MYVVRSKSIANFEFPRVTYIFRFFVVSCWYSYPSLMPTSSAILNVQLIFNSYFAWTCFGSSSIFASSVSETRKNHRRPDLENTVAAATLLCCFWQKIRAQATMCERGRYHSAKANFCSSTNPGVSDFAQIAHNLRVIFLIDRSTLKFWYRFFDPFFGIGKNRRWAKTRPSKIAVKN